MHGVTVIVKGKKVRGHVREEKKVIVLGGQVLVKRSGGYRKPDKTPQERVISMAEAYRNAGFYAERKRAERRMQNES